MTILLQFTRVYTILAYDWGVAIDWDWTDNRIFWTLQHTTRGYTLQIMVFTSPVMTASTSGRFPLGSRTVPVLYQHHLSTNSATNSQQLLLMLS
jgi:hypothetical protein